MRKLIHGEHYKTCHQQCQVFGAALTGTLGLSGVILYLIVIHHSPGKIVTASIAIA
jgi:hypothetical protein